MEGQRTGFERYGQRVEAYRLLKDQTQQAALQQQIGQDGMPVISGSLALTPPDR
ncbi:MAG TPA: hypothetical protein PKH77_11045 [Anaerolineae bacterium]|nr:hypothetical protein [Anaerolineae bacterium]